MADGLHLSTARGKWVLTATVLGSAMAQLDATRGRHRAAGHRQGVPRPDRRPAMGVRRLPAHRRRPASCSPARSATASDAEDLRHRRGVVRRRIADLRDRAQHRTADRGARCLQGVGGALLTPGSLAILEASFAPLRARACHRRVVRALGASPRRSGPFVGGFLITAVSWRLIFLINLPIAVAVIFISIRHVPEYERPRRHRLHRYRRKRADGAWRWWASRTGSFRGRAGNWSSPVVLGALGHRRCRARRLCRSSSCTCERRSFRSTSSNPVSSARPTGSRCSSTGCSAGCSSCCPSSSSRSRTTARPRQAHPCCRSRS